MKLKTKKLLAISLLLAIGITLVFTPWGRMPCPFCELYPIENFIWAPQPLDDLTQHYNVTRLTTSPADGRNPIWSPDVRKIYFKSGSYICVMDSDGSNVTKLAEGGHAALSPDGNKIFYIQKKGRELLYQAWVMNADGSNRKKIAELAFTYLSEDLGVEPLFLYSWSPDRTKIVVYESEYTGYGLRIENGSYVRSEPGDAVWPIYPGRIENGSYVRSEQKVKPSKEWPLLESIWTYGIWDLEKNTTRELTSFGPFEHGWPCLGEVVWSPYGKKIVLPNPELIESSICKHIWVIDAKNGEKRKLTSFIGVNAWPAWSPDGKKIMYLQSEVEGLTKIKNFDIWVMDSDGSNKKQLTESPMHEEGEWSPDGKRIAYISFDSDCRVFGERTSHKAKSEIWVMNADGTDKKQLLSIPCNNGLIMDMEWSPDGMKVAFVWQPNRDERKRDIYVIDVPRMDEDESLMR